MFTMFDIRMNENLVMKMSLVVITHSVVFTVTYFMIYPHGIPADLAL